MEKIMLLLVMVSTWCWHRKLKRIREMITWQFVVICGLPYFREKMGAFVVIKNKSRIWRIEYMLIRVANKGDVEKLRRLYSELVFPML